MVVSTASPRPLPHGAPSPAQTAANPDTPALARPGCSFVPCRDADHRVSVARYTPPRPSDADVIRGTTDHVKMMVHLQKRFSDHLGFLPEKALAWYAAENHVGIAKENGTGVGYILGRPAFAYQPLMRPITQAAVFLDAQRRHHGLKLVEAVCHKAATAGQHVVQASCAADLDACDFWMEAGFIPVFLHKLENRRQRDIVIFRRLLTPHCPDWFWTPPPRAGYLAKRTTPPNTPPHL